ncbi:DUF397 domain-containing protein [Streptomyces sp. NPDC007000]|uniref:DUF397 domain-containing protein n=1 Tax=unclassified Streptomyces TaxID=2593676 RepID=UPI00340C8B41
MSITDRTGHALAWFRSSYSNGAGGECVECAITDDLTHIRDSKENAGGRSVSVRNEAWRPFVQTVRSEQRFDGPLGS